MPLRTECHPLRRIAAVSLGVLVAALLMASAGCGDAGAGAGTPDATAPRTATAAPYTLSLAVASNAQFAMNDLVAAFTKSNPHATVKPTFGSSGNFQAQIMNGAPFDLYFSADTAYPKKLEDAGLVTPGSTFVYAVGSLVVWVPGDSRIDVGTLGMASLEHAGVRRIAIANPAVAPYGRAAVEAMKHAGIHDRVSGKLVLGENVGQVCQFVDSGAAEAAILPLALAVVMGPEKGRYWRIPAAAHGSIEQSAVILRRAASQDGAAAFMAFVKSPAGRAILAKHGLAPAASE